MNTMDASTKKLVKHGYNQLTHYLLVNRHLHEDLIHLRNLIARLPQGAKILDLGSGTGVPVDRYLAENDFKVTGIDISEAMVELATRLVPRAKFHLMDMETIDFPDKSFDAVIAFHSIYHVPKIKQPDLFMKIFKILNDGGYFMATFGTKELEGIHDFTATIKMYWSNFTKERYPELLRQAGFTVLYFERYRSGNMDHMVVFAQKPPKQK